MKIEIKKASVNDCEDIDRLIKQLHNLHVTNRSDVFASSNCIYSKKEILEMIKNDNMLCLTAQIEGKCVGMCNITYKETNHPFLVKVKIAYMEDICVDENFLDMGIGSALIHYAEDEAKRHGAQRLDLTCWSFNDNAVEFYKKFGMSVQRYIFEKEI